jgi:hypothetical protein
VEEIFISYAKEDRARVALIAKALKDQGWSVWWDRTIPPGKSFDQAIDKAIRAANCVVVLWSKNSIKSDWVKEEATIGKERRILVPAKIDSVVPPIGFGLIQAADLTDWEKNSSHYEFESFISAITYIVGSPSPPQKDEPVAEVHESGSEQQPSEGQPDDGEIQQSIPREPARDTVRASEPPADSTATSDLEYFEPLRTINVKKLSILAGVAVLLAAGIWWWLFEYTGGRRLRSEPRSVPSEDASKTFGLDEWGRPIEYIENQFEDRGQVVFDYATGLMWQKSGAQDFMTYEKALNYIEQRNREQFAGYSDWRMPTLPELISLLEPQKQTSGLYIDPTFDAHQRWCWSSDRSSSGAAWVVYFYVGNVDWLGISSRSWVRGVRS